MWLEATGRGHFVGVTMSVLQNQDGWWGEGDDMFFIDGEARPSIAGTGSEDYFLGAFDFGRSAFSYRLFGAPVKGEEHAGSRSSVYRFHLDSPIPFAKSIRATSFSLSVGLATPLSLPAELLSECSLLDFGSAQTTTAGERASRPSLHFPNGF